MQSMQTVHGERTLASEHQDAPTIARSWLLGALAVLAALSIAVWAFLFGGQPVAGDAQAYYDLARDLLAGGPGALASDLRTYGYPAFLAAIMLVVGQNVQVVHPSVFVVQVAILIGAAWLGARRLEGAPGMRGLGRVIFIATVANPFLLIHSVQLLTDLLAAVLIYLAVVLSLPQRCPEPASRVSLLAACALLCAGLAVMVRPSSLAVVPVVFAIWIARALIDRNLPWPALLIGAFAFVLPFVPQLWSNQRAFGVWNPLIVRSLYADQMLWGLQSSKYATVEIQGFNGGLNYENPFRPPPDLTLREVLQEQPGAYLAAFALHAFALVDQDFPFTYIRDVDPWHRWPLSGLNYAFLAWAVVGLVLGLRRVAGVSDAALLRQRLTILALGLAALAVVAIYLPTAVENRFSLPLYLLLAPTFALAAVRAYAAVPTSSPTRLTGGALALAAWIGLCAAGSVWIQSHAPLLAQIRALRDGIELPPRPVPPAIDVLALEVPSAAYVADLPKEVVVRSIVEFDVTVTNTGQVVWNRRGTSPVNVVARFVALKSDLHEKVKGVGPDSQTVRLPKDVTPGDSATVRFRILAPPEPGRYTLTAQVTRRACQTPTRTSIVS
ncbi:MAG TPA: hypothetical protein VFH48_30820 [Chloroflexota bacterium]|nr:hypothetical protein [Chloroflexota bacterium]